MLLETELKLLIATDDISKLITHPLLHQYSLGSPAHKHLVSYYFDTADHLLLQHGYALRIRAENGHYLQTIKGNNQSQQKGLHQRQEWQREVNEIKPDIHALPDLELHAFLTQEPNHPLELIFTTDFARNCWELHISNEAIIELALDIGTIKAGERTAAIQEVELELKG